MVARALRHRVRRWQPRIGWVPAVLLAVAVSVAAAGIVDADWVQGDTLLLYVNWAALVASALLVTLRVPGRWAAPILAGAGLLFVAESVSNVLPPPLDAARELLAGVVWLTLRLFRVEIPPPGFELWQESAARLIIFGERLGDWAVGLLVGQDVLNPTAFLFVSGVILWACTCWAVWWTARRGRPLLAMLPLGLLLSMSTYLSSGPVGWIMSFAACVMLLLPSVHLMLHERRWDREGIDYSAEIRLDMWQVAATLTMCVVLLSLITPSFSIPRLVWSFWELVNRPQAFIEEALSRFFGGVEPERPPDLPVPAGAAAGPGRVEASLPRSHLLGGSPDLTKQRVMYVCTDAPPPVTYEFIPEEEVVWPQHYWRGITYDTFGGWYWENGLSRRSEVPAYEPILASTVSNTQSLRQRYLIEVPHGDTLYAVGEPRTVDQPLYRRLRTPDDLVGIMGETSDYVVVSDVSQATVRQLRAAPADYTGILADRYLALPDDTPRRVLALAEEITEGIDSSYDKAVAIERFLRQFEYDLTVPVPPPRQNVVEFFLFDVQRGYCDYYASAFVVLARAAGVPSRLAVGYVTGWYDLDRECYEVTERDGHSWPEVFFPGYGWIPFEPTASFRTFERPQDELATRESMPGLPSVPQRPWSLSVRKWWNWAQGRWPTYVAIAALAALLVLLVRQAFRQWWYSRLTVAEAIAYHYREMVRLGEGMGAGRRPHHTPAEYGTALEAALRERVARWPWRGRRLRTVSREAGAHVQSLSRAYERASYASHLLLTPHQIRAERQWQLLRRQMWWLWLTSEDGRATEEQI